MKEIIDGLVKNNIIIEIEIWTFTNRKAVNHEILVWMEYEEDENKEELDELELPERDPP